MPECKHHNICGLDVGPAETEFCILHSQNPEKDIEAFEKALEAHHEDEEKNNFAYMLFPQKVDFIGATFTERADFRGTTFTQDADFGEARFTQGANFHRATFTQRANFGEARFTQESSFAMVRFTQDAHFYGARFTQGVIFGGATFTQHAHFYGVTFTQHARFQEAKFTQEASFQEATFSSQASFEAAQFTGEISFRSSRFQGRTLFSARQTEGQVEQTDPVFSKAINIEFREVSFETSDITFRNADLQRCQFLGTDMRTVHLVDVIWPRVGPRIVGRRIGVYDENLDRNRRGWWSQRDEHTLARIERLYRQLKQNHEDQRDYERASDFHYGEKEMRRLNPSTPLSRKGLLWLYWLVSGYGERIPRPLVAVAVVWTCFALIYMLCGLKPKLDNTNKDSQISHIAFNWDNIRDSTWDEALAYSFKVITFQRPQDYRIDGLAVTVLYTIQSVTGPLLFGLLALAVRQRLKR